MNKPIHRNTDKYRYLLDIILLGVIVILLILSIVFTSVINNLNYDQLNFIAKNWIASPIEEIDVNCSKNNSFPLLEDSFPANYEGCYCSNNNQTQQFFKSSSCPINCNKVYQSPSLSYTGWDSNVLCGYRTNNTYLDLIIKDKESRCTDLNKKSCGFIDSFNNILCREKSEKCPINYLRFVNNEKELDTIINNFKQLNVEYNNITFNNNGTSSYLIYSNNYNQGTIYTQFKVGFNQPCIFEYESNIPSFTYPLQKLPKTTKCETELNQKNTNVNYVKIDSKKYESLLKANGIYDYAKNDLFYQNSILEENINLYAKNYFGINYLCIDRFQNFYSKWVEKTNFYILETLLDFQFYFTKGDNSPNAIMPSIIVVFIMIIILLITNIIQYKQKDGKNILYIVNSFFIYFLILVNFMLLVLLTTRIKYAQSIYEWLYDSEMCVDPILWNSISSFSSKFMVSKILSYIVIGILLIVSIIPIGLFTIDFCVDVERKR